MFVVDNAVAGPSSSLLVHCVPAACAAPLHAQPSLVALAPAELPSGVQPLLPAPLRVAESTGHRGHMDSKPKAAVKVCGARSRRASCSRGQRMSLVDDSWRMPSSSPAVKDMFMIKEVMTEVRLYSVLQRMSSREGEQTGSF